MYLNREILPCVDELDQQRELLAETFEVGFAEQCGAVAGDQARQGSAGFGTSCYDRFVAFDARKLPAFADLRLAGCDLFVGGTIFSPPQIVDLRMGWNLYILFYYAFCASSWLRANAYAPTEMALLAPSFEIATPMRFWGS